MVENHPRCGLALGGNDIYLNVAGGLRINEPAADLAVAAALVSALTGEAVPADTVVFGEIGLSGEVRAVSQRDLRLKEAAKLGFREAWAPRLGAGAKKRGQDETKDAPLTMKDIGHVQDIVSRFPGAPAVSTGGGH